MQLDIAALVAPLSDEAPSGPDLTYDDERIEIESAFERSISVDGAAGEEADWRKVIGQITAQAERTRDIWLPVYLMRAAASSKQFELLVSAAELLAALLEERWDDVHPQLDEYGFIGRKTPCESLTRIGDFLGPLAQVPLFEHARFGRFGGADIERFAEKGGKADGYGQFRAVLDASDQDAIDSVVAQFDALRAAIKRVDAVLTNNADGDTATNFQPTYEALGRIRTALGKVLPGQQAEAAAGADAGAAADDEGQAAGGGESFAAMAGGPAFSGSIRNRGDVARAIDAICAYYAACEPASPVPLVLQRARDWINLDFLAVLEDIAPGALSEAGMVLRSQRAGGDGAGGGSGGAATDDSWGGGGSSSAGWDDEDEGDEAEAADTGW